MMTFNESYGELPESTLRMIRKYKITPSEYSMLLDKFGYVYPPFPEIEKFILANVRDRLYRAPTYY